MCNRILYSDWEKTTPTETRVEYFHSPKEYRGLSYSIGIRLLPGVKMTGETVVPVHVKSAMSMLLHRLAMYKFLAVILITVHIAAPTAA